VDEQGELTSAEPPGMLEFLGGREPAQAAAVVGGVVPAPLAV
jgi:hypothetical protein